MWTLINSIALIGGKSICKKNPLQDLLSSLNAVISTNDSTPIIKCHVIFNLAYIYKFQLKTTQYNEKKSRFVHLLLIYSRIESYIWSIWLPCIQYHSTSSALGANPQSSLLHLKLIFKCTENMETLITSSYERYYNIYRCNLNYTWLRVTNVFKKKRKWVPCPILKKS